MCKWSLKRFIFFHESQQRAAGWAPGLDRMLTSLATWNQRWKTQAPSLPLSTGCSWSLWCRHRAGTLWHSHRPSWSLQTGRACHLPGTPGAPQSLPAEQNSVRTEPWSRLWQWVQTCCEYLARVLAPVMTASTKHVVCDQVSIIVLLPTQGVSKDVHPSLTQVLRWIPQTWREQKQTVCHGIQTQLNSSSTGLMFFCS